jgi:hypothetical protein
MPPACHKLRFPGFLYVVVLVISDSKLAASGVLCVSSAIQSFEGGSNDFWPHQLSKLKVTATSTFPTYGQSLKP